MKLEVKELDIRLAQAKPLLRLVHRSVEPPASRPSILLDVLGMLVLIVCTGVVFLGFVYVGIPTLRDVAAMVMG